MSPHSQTLSRSSSVSAPPDHHRPPVAPAPTLPSFTESFNVNYDHDVGYRPSAPLGSLYTAQHLIILHHTFTSVERDSIVARDQMQGVVEIAIRDAVEAPYLIDQLLALSALHLAARIDSGDSRKAGNPAALRHQATELQTRAVSSFTRLTADLPTEDKATCVPRFLFTSLLSLQVLAETLHQHRQFPNADNGRPTPLHDFIKRMVDCMRLHRSMLSLIRPTWNYLLQTELFPLLRTSHDAANEAEIKVSQGTECRHLEQLIRAPPDSTGAGPPLDPASASACLSCIDRLQWAFDMQNSLPDQDVPHAACSFIIMNPSEFADVLQTLRPEALIILAYFSVLLHRCRKFWVFENVGANIIRAIVGHLGPRWRDALAWPLRVIETEND
ncbi:hypothetical protein ESCO_002195 [Escovopsis weberi]|uniref:Sterol uptake control protein 2 n=1 Tax=Escovopsis weberi TaxID=150374 RepID=A0A0M8N7T2_ESCWE|nr:hypothetical protein ESCO_002195 [Escovopsis weberi]